MWDVIIVGAGPGGAAAARECADLGMKTLVLEKKELPRDKVCSGMVAGPMARDIIQKKFGTIPMHILAPPHELSGQMFHVPGIKPESLEWKTLLAWRKDLDFWLVEKAGEKGAQIWDGVRVTGFEEAHGRHALIIKRKNSEERLAADFLIGADGAGSQIRKYIFPKLKVRYSVPIRECYEGSLDLDKGYLHWFFPRSLPRPRFNVNHKGDCFLIEGGGVKELRPEIQETLLPYGFHPESKPLWRDACMIPWLHEELTSGSFRPAKGNVLLVGDAAGLLFPITFEGIGIALKSGILAAASTFEAAGSEDEAAGIYLNSLKQVLGDLKTLYFLGKKLENERTEGGAGLLRALKSGYGATLKVV
jgi:flavin-dependent dehydrogenase